jgi:peptide chain release factor subunit 1
MATVVTEGLLRELAGFHAANGCAISLFLDFDPSETPTVPAEKTKFHARLLEWERLAAEKAEGKGRDCRLALRDDFARLEDWGENDFDRDGARALAIFSSSGDGLFRIVPLVDPVRDSWDVGPDLDLAPLVPQLGRGNGALVAVVSRERGVVYRLENGSLEEIADESDDVPGQHDQGGWSQARYQRHIDNVVQRHLKAVGEEIERTTHDRNVRIVGVGPEEIRSSFEEALSKEAREAIVGWVTADQHASPHELLAAVQPVLDEAHAREEAALLERLEAREGRGDPAATGWAETLEAASDARVDTLFLEERVEHPAFVCPRDGRAYAADGECPLDGAKLERRDDGANVAVHRTIANGGRIVVVGQGALGPSKVVGGIAALLRF